MEITMAENESDIGITTNTPYLAFTGELWGVYCEHFGFNLPRNNGTALQLEWLDKLYSLDRWVDVGFV